MDLSSLSSIAGIIALTTLFMSGLKLKWPKIFETVPPVIVSALTAVALTLVAIFVTHTMTGNTVNMCITVAIMVFSAAGPHVDDPSSILDVATPTVPATLTTTTQTTVAAKTVPILLMLMMGTMFLAGCTPQPDLSIFATGVIAGEAPIHAQMKADIAAKIANGTLTPAQAQIQLNEIAAVEAFEAKHANTPSTVP